MSPDHPYRQFLQDSASLRFGVAHAQFVAYMREALRVLTPIGGEINDSYLSLIKLWRDAGVITASEEELRGFRLLRNLIAQTYDEE